MKIYFKTLGGHVHMKVFYNGKAGDLVCTVEEFDNFRRSFAVAVAWEEERSW